MQLVSRCFKVVSACVGVAIGPVTARAIELLLSSKQVGSGTLDLLLAACLVNFIRFVPLVQELLDVFACVCNCVCRLSQHPEDLKED